MSRKPPTPSSAELVAEWHRLSLLQEHGDHEGGNLGDMTRRAVARERQLRAIEVVLCERIYAEPAVQR